MRARDSASASAVDASRAATATVGTSAANARSVCPSSRSPGRGHTREGADQLVVEHERQHQLVVAGDVADRGLVAVPAASLTSIVAPLRRSDDDEVVEHTDQQLGRCAAGVDAAPDAVDDADRLARLAVHEVVDPALHETSQRADRGGDDGGDGDAFDVVVDAGDQQPGDTDEDHVRRRSATP